MKSLELNPRLLRQLSADDRELPDEALESVVGGIASIWPDAQPAPINWPDALPSPAIWPDDLPNPGINWPDALPFPG